MIATNSQYYNKSPLIYTLMGHKKGTCPQTTASPLRASNWKPTEAFRRIRKNVSDLVDSQLLVFVTIWVELYAVPVEWERVPLVEPPLAYKMADLHQRRDNAGGVIAASVRGLSTRRLPCEIGLCDITSLKIRHF